MKCLTVARKAVVKFLTGQEEGLSVVEYGLLLALLALVCFAVVTALGSRINTVCSNLGASL